jgi:hypothetical protein
VPKEGKDLYIIKEKFSLEQTMKAQKGSRYTGLLIRP